MEYLSNPTDLVDEIGSNQKWMEEICMACYVTMNDAQDLLIDYSLWVGERDMYPIKRQPAFYGFHRWLRNSNRFKKAQTKKGGNTGGLVI